MNSLDKMQKFLDIVKNNQIDSSNDIYSLIAQYNLSEKYEGDFYNYFDKWQNDFKDKSNINAFRVASRKCFLFFTNGILNSNPLKLYIPMDSSHLYGGVKLLFDFIAENNIVHQSKVANIMRNDNVVVRVNNLEDAQKIINFVNNNSYIREGRNEVNPFLINCNNVGLAMDYGNYSYNGVLTKTIYNFLNSIDDKNDFNVLNLRNYIGVLINNTTDLELKDIYKQMYINMDKNFNINKFVSFASNKLVDKYDSTNKRITDPEFYLRTAINTTREVYPGNEVFALNEYMNNDNDRGFTNTNMARNGLRKYISSSAIPDIIKNKLDQYNVTYDGNNFIEKYINLINYKELSLEDKFNIVRIAYLNTQNKYDEYQADGALKRLLFSHNVDSFTNDFKDRDKLNKYVINSNIENIIFSNIDTNNLDITNIDDVINRFHRTIMNEEDTKLK